MWRDLRFAQCTPVKAPGFTPAPVPSLTLGPAALAAAGLLRGKLHGADTASPPSPGGGMFKLLDPPELAAERLRAGQRKSFR